MKHLIRILLTILILLTAVALMAVNDAGAATPTPVAVYEMTPVTTVTPGSAMYIVQSPAATPVDRQANVQAVVHAGILPISIGAAGVSIADEVSIGYTTSISQTSASGAAAVLELDQADDDQAFVILYGTSYTATLTNNLVSASDVTTATVLGYLAVQMVDATGLLTTSVCYVPVYGLE